ncbi:GCG_CRPN prefix-to-repeats domain-containing protein [Ancylobacter mangrovi]|uniref:GCG_CRPN prefix-to-repeats domain-containing protein n=1 Tax=Ancylobacter mangrovi TaxID=2972472 RepID=UPI0035A89F2C
MKAPLLKCVAALGFLMASALSAVALPLPASLPAAPTVQIVPVANGCGPGWYRGPGGACHRFGLGPYPGGYYGPYGGDAAGNGCPPGYWRGPWGHCRDTPFHGRLPDGTWQ